MRIVVTGAAGAVGQRVVRHLHAHHPDADILGVDRVALAAAPGTSVKQVDLGSSDLGGVFAAADTVVHLASATVPDAVDPSADALELVILRRVLDAAHEAGVRHLVVLSTAMVYGAWVGNPVPFTEDAPVRPNPDFAWANVRAAVEQAALEWGVGRDVAVAVLRPTAVVTDDALGKLARVLHSARVGIAAEGDPPVQYLHVDDLVSAISVVVVSQFDGVANVAPDGWIPPDELRNLEGPRARVRVPGWAARAIAALRFGAGLSSIPPGIVPYTSHSWVVSNDRIRSLGWSATYTNEEAWVVSHEPSTLDRLPARRQQELALAAVGALVVLFTAGVVLVVRRARRRERSLG